jgi:hypothetical protein
MGVVARIGLVDQFAIEAFFAAAGFTVPAQNDGLPVGIEGEGKPSHTPTGVKS